jgi:hypothetical protein
MTPHSRWTLHFLFAPERDHSNVFSVFVSSSGDRTQRTTVLATKGGGDALLWRLNGEGTTVWAAHGGGSSSDYLNGVCVDYAGHVIAGGSYYGSAATFGGVTLPVASGSDAVLWKLQADGTTLWALRGGGQYNDEIRSVAVDHAGAVVAAGNVQIFGTGATMTFGHVTFSRSSASGATKPFLWKVNGAGTTEWAIAGDGDSNAWDSLNGVSVDNAGNIFAAGSVRSSSFTFGGNAVASPLGSMMWKFGRDGVALWNAQIDGYNLMDIAADATGGAVAMLMRNRTAVLWKVTAQGTTAWSVEGGGTTSNDYDDLYMGEARRLHYFNS